MIKLISRSSVFTEHPTIASLIAKFQLAMLGEEELESCSEDEIEEVLEMNDALSLKLHEEVSHNNILGIEEQDLTSFTNKLSNRLIELLSELQINDLIVVSHYKMNIFGNLKNLNPPLRAAYKQLYDVTKSYTYKEAFEVNLQSLPLMINIVFWLERCDPSAPEYIFFADKSGRLTFFLCKHGKVHIITPDNKIMDAISSKQEWQTYDTCSDNFSMSESIEGRTLNL